MNAIELGNDPDFGRDMDRLVAAVEQVFAVRPRRPGGGWFRRSVQLQNALPFSAHMIGCGTRQPTTLLCDEV